VLVHQLAEARRIARLQRFATLVAEFLHVMQVPQHAGVTLLRARVLILQDTAGASREARKE
jgi:hypothetical protein